MSSLQRQNSKEMQNHSEKRIKKHLVTIPLMDENKNIGKC